MLIIPSASCIFLSVNIFNHVHRYESLDPAVLPRLWLVYAAEPSDSGAVHSDVRQRWQRGDADVAAAMTTFADIAQAGRWVPVGR